ncbi:MAG TPA: hypothetical protein VHO70_01660 [Chitinispirillaceae bacterium]|nr:hypothetical protein [Chitinispirillaceae bacterium]
MNTPLIEKISELIPSDKSFYYSFDDDTRRDISRKLIAAINTEGMILGTPDEVIIRDTNDEIPLLWLQRFLAIRKWQVEKK